MTAARIGAKGQLVIPKAVRDQARLHPGDEVDVVFEDERIVIAGRRRPAGLAGRFRGSGMAERLLEDRGREPR
ncbi:MAG TPA: AbrB/MazE/SpoVT family DNA-binding domain-containing protein [Solirubrobacteraceae bacterium]|nr:AbrB/MazE/SpoVT family DNA-binding domain-containing protein [Solirubrobacteraceae bacterium]